MRDIRLKKSGVDAGTAGLARQINAAQQPEITQMNGWLKACGMDMARHGDGMATPAETKKVAQADETAVGRCTWS